MNSSAATTTERERSSPPQEPHVLSSLPILILYPHSRCNCRCLMCDIWKVTTAEEISADALQAHVADIRALRVEWVVFSGGEPLMHSDLFRLARILESCSVRTTLLTTGLLLERYASQVARSIHDVIVSLDGPPEVHDRIRRLPGAFAQLAQGVKALRREAASPLRGEGPAEIPAPTSDDRMPPHPSGAIARSIPISARCTVQRANHRDLRRVVATAIELGLDSVSFLAADLTSTAFNRPAGWTPSQQDAVGLSLSEVDALEQQIETLIQEHRSEIDSGFIREDETKLRRLVAHFRGHLGAEEPRAPRCNAPWVSAVLESDGTLRPCFFHPPIGKVGPGALREVLNSETAVTFRRQLDVATNETCRRCVCSLYREPQRQV